MRTQTEGRQQQNLQLHLHLWRNYLPLKQPLFLKDKAHVFSLLGNTRESWTQIMQIGWVHSILILNRGKFGFRVIFFLFPYKFSFQLICCLRRWGALPCRALTSAHRSTRVVIVCVCVEVTLGQVWVEGNLLCMLRKDLLSWLSLAVLQFLLSRYEIDTQHANASCLNKTGTRLKGGIRNSWGNPGQMLVSRDVPNSVGKLTSHLYLSWPFQYRTVKATFPRRLLPQSHLAVLSP